MSRTKVIVCILIGLYTTVLVVCNVACCKKTLHFDELFSYGSANTPYNYEDMVGNREWKDTKQMFEDYLCVNDNDLFNYQMVWRNQSNDVHPPLYYAIIHTVCSFVPNSFSIWTAALINLFFFLLTLPALYKVCMKIFHNDRLAFTICFIFATSNIMMSITMFLRMYVLLLCIALWSVYFHLDWMDNTNQKKKLIFVYLITLFGFLTHYYFLIFMFFLACGVGIIIISQKKIKELLSYGLTIGLAGVTFVGVYPASIQHIFHGYRGEEAFENITTLNNYSDILNNYFNQLGNGIFGIMWNGGVCTCTTPINGIVFCEDRLQKRTWSI